MLFNVKETKTFLDGLLLNILEMLESISIFEYILHHLTTASSTGAEGHLRPPLSLENIKPYSVEVLSMRLILLPAYLGWITSEWQKS